MCVVIFNRFSFGGGKTLYDDIKAYEPIFGSYTVARKVGDGRCGKVYEIERKERNTVFKAALKHITIPADQNDINNLMIADGLDRDGVKEYLEDLVNKVYDEVVLMSSLKGNSNIVGYEDYQLIEHDDKIQWDILVRMELLTNLIDYMGKTEIEAKDVINLGIDICKALEVCGKKHIIHRDVSPDNIFVSETGEFKLGDFGISRRIENAVTQNSSLGGNPVYMAPELYSGNNYDATVDIYSLGIVLYQLLNRNRVPFMPDYDTEKRPTHTDRENAVKRRMSGEKIPPPKDVDERLAKIILKSIEYKPKERYGSPAEMRAELEAYKSDITDKNLIFPADKKAEGLLSEQESSSVIWRFDDISETESVKPVNSPTVNEKTEEKTENFSSSNYPGANANGALSKNQLGMAEKNSVSGAKAAKKEKKSKEGKSSSPKIWIVLTASIAAIAVIAGAVFLMTNRKNSATSADNVQIPETDPKPIKTEPSTVKANLGDEFYAKITPVEGAKSWLTGYDGKVYFQEHEDDFYQIFRFTRNEDGTYRIQLVINDMVITASKSGTNDAFSVLLDNYSDSELQAWFIEATPENEYVLTSKAVSGFAVASGDGNGMLLQKKSGGMQLLAIENCSAPTLEWRLEGYESDEPYKEYELLWFNGANTGIKRYTGNVKPVVVPDNKSDTGAGRNGTGNGSGGKGSGGSKKGGNGGGNNNGNGGNSGGGNGGGNSNGGSNPSGNWAAQGDW